ncbi:hypothetical protein [Polaromonas sp. CG9_12]|nr:hypothetical protein [Polaromonas sp. CG9_12]
MRSTPEWVHRLLSSAKYAFSAYPADESSYEFNSTSSPCRCNALKQGRLLMPPWRLTPACRRS